MAKGWTLALRTNKIIESPLDSARVRVFQGPLCLGNKKEAVENSEPGIRMKAMLSLPDSHHKIPRPMFP